MEYSFKFQVSKLQRAESKIQYFYSRIIFTPYKYLPIIPTLFVKNLNLS